MPRRFTPVERLSRRALLATDVLEGPVVVKVTEGPEGARSRALAREFERLAGLSHPGFPRAGSFGFLADGRAWMSMERCTGELPVGPMAWDELARLADGLCEALAHLHARRLLHRDLKPDHVRFDAATGRVMLLDLGSAAPVGVASRVGTPGYMAPEVANGKRADERSDVHGLGAILYELATGRPVHAGDATSVLRAQRDGRFEALSSARPDAPPRFSELVTSMLAADPKLRPSTVASVREQLAATFGAPAGAVVGGAPFTGRERELDALVELAERARHASVAVMLAGPEGSGRTTLLEALRCRLLLGGMPVLRRTGQDLTMAALSRALALTVDAPVGAAPGEPLEEIAAALAGCARAVSANASLRGPVAILIDDVGLASLEARADLAALASALPPGVLLVVTDAPRGDALGAALPARVDLGPLPEASIRELLAGLQRRAPEEDAVARALSSTRQPGAVVAAARPGGAVAPSAAIATDDEDPAALLRRGRIPAAVAAWQARHLALPDGFEGERARCLARLGHALWAMAEPADALARAEAALGMASGCGDAGAEAEAARVLGRIYGSFGSTRDGVGWQRRALELAAENDDVPRAAALSELGVLMLREGHVEAALRALTESVREAEAAKDAAGAALSRARLGKARFMSGDLGGADRLLRRALAEAKAADDCLVIIEAQRLLGTTTCACGDSEAGLALLQSALARAAECGVLQELPALHEALAQAHLDRAVRLRTPTGAIVDRRELEVARAHVEKGLDLALATGRMADRAALAVLSSRCALLVSDPRAAQAAAEEAHVLALEAGDLLVASQARLVKSEALLDLREFGVALAEARIGSEALTRSGDLERAWRGHALLARIHGAWGMGAKQAEETENAARLLRKLEASLRDPRLRRAYLADVDRAAALAPPVPADSTKARRGLAPELAGTRFAGRADTEDLVEALIEARKRAASLERRLRSVRLVAREARTRRDALLRACSLAGTDGASNAKELARVLDLLSRACAGARIVLATSHAGRLRVRGAAGSRGAFDPSAHEAALVVARRVVETGKGSLALGAVGHRRTDPPSGDVHVALPLEAEGSAFGALVVRPCDGRVLRRADVRLLRAAASLLSRAVSPVTEPEEATTGR